MTGDARTPEVRSWRRLRRAGEACLWLLVIGVAVVAFLDVATRLRLVVLPLLLAIVLATFLTPLVRRLTGRGWPDAAAALAVLTAALVPLAGVAAWVVPAIVDEFGDLDVGVADAVDQAQEWITGLPLPISEQDVSDAIDRLQEQVGESVDALVGPLYSGAVIALEVAAGLVLALVTLFFLLKDGDRLWDWVVGLAPPHRRDDARAAGARAWQALGGFVRGQTIVALFDAVLIGLGLVVLGVPLALPLAVLTFFGAYVPIIGAAVTGLLAVLLALVSQGIAVAALVLALIVVVQQIEGNVLQPAVVGRAIDVHPLAILFGVTAGAVLAGIIGAMIAAPLVAVGGSVLRYARERSEGNGPGTAGDPDQTFPQEGAG